MERFIGLDVHRPSTTCAVIDARGKRLRVDVVETNGQTLIEFLKLQPGTLRLCMEEGTQALWLAEILSPHVEQLAVVHVTESRGPKDDERDALALAEQMRTGKLDTTVYKHVGPFGALRNLVKTHGMVVRDVVRTQNRIRAMFRSRGVPVVGKAVYGTKEREAWVAKLPTNAQGAGRLLYAQYDAVNDVREEAEKKLVEESHRHPITRVLETCPGVGPIRAAQIVSVVVTPHPMVTRAQRFW
jgi:transposase